MSNKEKKDTPKSKKNTSFLTSFLIPVLLAAGVMFPVSRTMYSGDPMMAIIPNFLLFTPFREEARNYWKQLIKIDRNVQRVPHQIPVIDAKDYSYESLRLLLKVFVILL